MRPNRFVQPVGGMREPARLTAEDFEEMRRNYALLHREERSPFERVKLSPRDPVCIPSYFHLRMPEFFEPDDFVPPSAYRCFIQRTWIRPRVDATVVELESNAVNDDDKLALIQTGYFFYRDNPIDAARWAGEPPRLEYPPLLRPAFAFRGVKDRSVGMSTWTDAVSERMSPAEVVLDEPSVDTYLKKTDTYKKAGIYGDAGATAILQIRRAAILNATKTENALAQLSELGVRIKSSAWERMITRDRKAVLASEKTQTLSVLTKAGLLRLGVELGESSRDFLESIANGFLPRTGRTETIEDFKHRHQAVFDANGHFQGFQRSQFAKGRLARRNDFQTWAEKKYEPDQLTHAPVAMSDGYRAPRSSDEYAVWCATLAPWLRRLVAAPEQPRWQFLPPEKNLLPPDLMAGLDLQPLMSTYPQYSERTSTQQVVVSLS